MLPKHALWRPAGQHLGLIERLWLQPAFNCIQRLLMIVGPLDRSVAESRVWPVVVAWWRNTCWLPDTSKCSRRHGLCWVSIQHTHSNEFLPDMVRNLLHNLQKQMQIDPSGIVSSPDCMLSLMSEQ